MLTLAEHWAIAVTLAMCQHKRHKLVPSVTFSNKGTTMLHYNGFNMYFVCNGFGVIIM